MFQTLTIQYGHVAKTCYNEIYCGHCAKKQSNKNLRTQRTRKIANAQCVSKSITKPDRFCAKTKKTELKTKKIQNKKTKFFEMGPTAIPAKTTKNGFVKIINIQRTADVNIMKFIKNFI